MNKEHKKSLIIRGTLRTAAAASVVVGMSHIYPPFAPVYIMAGYGSVLASMESTARKMKIAERVDEKFKDSSFFEKPKANAIESFENRLIDVYLKEKIDYLKKYLSKRNINFNLLKKSKFVLNNNKNNLKHKNINIEQKVFEKEL